jgi:hypothetical protein
VFHFCRNRNRPVCSCSTAARLSRFIYYYRTPSELPGARAPCGCDSPPSPEKETVSFDTLSSPLSGKHSYEIRDLAGEESVREKWQVKESAAGQTIGSIQGIKNGTPKIHDTPPANTFASLPLAPNQQQMEPPVPRPTARRGPEGPRPFRPETAAVPE